ncbi:MAG: hypothetical protein DRQ24_09300 [Candidatus Latescibacterota bacterium]|nr:MAG: hypothetical protein DRQ24_09300 [Candidatus Latescibacterota bacterium]
MEKSNSLGTGLESPAGHWLSVACVIVLWIFPLFLLPVTVHSLPEDEIASLVQKIEELKARQQQLELQRRRLICESDSLAQKIEGLKQKVRQSKGIFSERRLKEALRHSQRLVQRLKQLEREIEANKALIAQHKVRLKYSYEHQIAQLLERMEKSRNKKEAHHLLLLLRRFQAEKKALESETERRKITDILQIEQIKIDKDDTAEQIREKADLMSDFVDKLKSQLRLLDQKIQELEEEKENQERVEELVEEFSLFDDDRMAIRALKVQAEERAYETEGLRNRDVKAPLFTTEGKTSVEPAPDVSGGEERIITNDIEEEIDKLKQKKTALSQKLSRLSRKAEEFYQKAAELAKPRR